MDTARASSSVDLTSDLDTPPGELPDFLEVADLTCGAAFSERTVRSHIKRLGIAEKIGNKLYVARTVLRDRWPNLHDALLLKAQKGRALRSVRAA